VREGSIGGAGREDVRLQRVASLYTYKPRAAKKYYKSMKEIILIASDYLLLAGLAAVLRLVHLELEIPSFRVRIAQLVATAESVNIPHKRQQLCPPFFLVDPGPGPENGRGCGGKDGAIYCRLGARPAFPSREEFD